MSSIGILGAGWLGFALTKHFIVKGYRVNASTTTTMRLAELGASGARAYLLDINYPNKQMEEFLKVDILIVCIALKQVDSFKNLVAAMNKSDVKKVIYISSTSVYKNLSNPLLGIESLFQSSNQFETTVIRFGGLIGPGRNPGRFFRSGKSVMDPDTGVNLIHLHDCIGIVDRVVEKSVWSEVFNGVADTHPTKREFYAHAAKQAGMAEPVFSEQKSMIYEPVSNEYMKNKLSYQLIHPDIMKISYVE